MRLRGDEAVPGILGQGLCDKKSLVGLSKGLSGFEQGLEDFPRFFVPCGLKRAAEGSKKFERAGLERVSLQNTGSVPLYVFVMPLSGLSR